MQTCIKCGTEKLLSEFYAHKQMALGVDSKCKECVKFLARQRRRDCPKKAKDIDHRKYINRRNAHLEKCKEYYENNKDGICEKINKWKDGNRSKINKYNQAWAKNNPEKRKASVYVGNTIRSGRLPKASTIQCNRCNKQAQNYHHWSYKEEHWLDVEALCIRCHNLADKERREQESLMP